MVANHISARNPFREVEADLPGGCDFPTWFFTHKLESDE